MKLTAGELAALLPLLRPDVLIEIVLHGDGQDTEHPAVDGRKRRWTQEEKDAAGRRMREARERKREAAALEEITEIVTPPSESKPVVHPPTPKHDPNAAQLSVIREAIKRERAQNGETV